MGDIAHQNRALGIAASLCRDGGHFGVPHLPVFVKNANYVGYEAKICAHNVLHTINKQHQQQQQRQSRDVNPNQTKISILASLLKRVLDLVLSVWRHHPSNRLLKYPEDAYGGDGSVVTTTSATRHHSDVLLPLSVCVSLGPYNSVLIINDVVIGGSILGRFAALTKHIIEVAKVAELKGQLWAKLFWFLVYSLFAIKNTTEHYLRKYMLRMQLNKPTQTAFG